MKWYWWALIIIAVLILIGLLWSMLRRNPSSASTAADAGAGRPAGSRPTADPSGGVSQDLVGRPSTTDRPESTPTPSSAPPSAAAAPAAPAPDAVAPPAGSRHGDDGGSADDHSGSAAGAADQPGSHRAGASTGQGSSAGASAGGDSTRTHSGDSHATDPAATAGSDSAPDRSGSGGSAGPTGSADGPTNSVLDAGYDPKEATQVMGMTPEPADDHHSADASDSMADPNSASTGAQQAPTGTSSGQHSDKSTDDTSGSDDQRTVRAVAGPYGSDSAEPNADGSGPDGFPIKGDADSMLYHVPDSRFFARTKAGVWFATEEGARAAGFNPPGSH
jgi:hypothetical protein